MLEKVQVLYHSSIKIISDKIIYIDPFKITENYLDADIIFCTHPHYDHFSPKDIKKIKKENTIIVTVEETKMYCMNIGFKKENIFIAQPNNKYKINGIEFITYESYNKDKPYHQKENGWLGYNININNTWYYVAGDTDDLKSLENINCDVCFLPVGGTYTMDFEQAARLANCIMPKLAIPIHYGSIVGSKNDGQKFANKLNKKIDYKILLK